MQAELNKTKNESETYLAKIMDMKAKQAEEMDQVQMMHDELKNSQKCFEIERKRFEEQ